MKMFTFKLSKDVSKFQIVILNSFFLEAAQRKYILSSLALHYHLKNHTRQNECKKSATSEKQWQSCVDF